MKKFKLIALALAASTLGLTSCDLPEWAQNIPGIDKIIPSEENKEGEKGEKGDEKVDPKVLSVKISGKPASVTDETEAFSLVATVEVEGGASKEVTWSSSNDSVATVDQEGHVTPVLGAGGTVVITATSKEDSSIKDSVSIEVVTEPGIASVSVTNSEGVVIEEDSIVLYSGTMELGAFVTSKGGAAKGVTWSSSDPTIATVSEEGEVSFFKGGDVIITATSSFDSSKSGSVTIHVINKGMHPELLDDGWAFSESFPSEAAAEFVGSQVLGFEAQEGFYYIYHEAQGNNVEFLQIYTEYTEANVNALAVAYKDAGYFYSEDYGNCFIDPSVSYELDVFPKNLSSVGSNYVLSLCIYHLDQLWVLETTTDTEWNESVGNLLESKGLELPFVALGNGYKAKEQEGAIYIYDSCANYHLLDNYEEMLEGFEKITSEDGEYFAKQIDEFTVEFVSFGFSENGNMIIVGKEPIELEEYPGTAVDTFIAEVIGSEHTLPAFTGEGFVYTYEDLSDEEGPAIGLGFENASEEQCISYVNDLVENYGFKVDAESSIEQQSGISATFLQKGKICLVAEMIYDLREATEEENEELYDEFMDLYMYFYWGMESWLTDEEVARYNELYSLIYDFDNMLFMTYDYENVIAGYLIVYGDPEGIEGEGLFFEKTSGKYDVGEEFELIPVFNKIEEATVIYSSSDESIATVDENGVVSCLAEGTVIIEGSIEGTEYSAEFALTVRNVLPIMEYIPEAIAFYAGYDVELVLPNVSGAIAFEEGVSGGTPYVEITVEDSVDEAMYNYALKLLGEGFEVSYDEYNEAYTAVKGEVKIVFYEYYSVLNIDFYFLEPIESEWPLARIEMMLENLELSGTIPAYESENAPATGFIAYREGNQIAIIVEEGNEQQAIEDYVAILLENGYEEYGEDEYGDMQYVNYEDGIILCPWDASLLESPLPGYVIVDVYELPEVFETFPIDEFNEFCETYGLDIVLTEDMLEGLEATGFTVEFIDGTYPRLLITCEGDYLEAFNTAFSGAAIEAGFSLSSQTDTKYHYTNSSNSYFDIYLENGNTVVRLWK